MGLKILHSADWHLDSPFTSFGRDQRELLKEAQRALPGAIAMAARQESCDLVLLAGDLFDGSWSRDTLDLTRDALAECRCPVLISPGNHDFWGADCPWQELWPENVFIFPPQLTSREFPELDCRVWGAGFSSMDCPPLLENFHAEGEEQWQIGLFHGDPVTPGSHYNPVTAAQIRGSGLSYLALGHVHKAGGLEIGQTVCGWPGCPMGRGWDETGEKGYLLAELGDSVVLEPRALPGIRFTRESLEIGEDPEKNLENLLPAGESRDFYRITLTGYGKPDLRKLRARFPGIPNLELRDETVDPGQLWDQAGKDTLRGVYFSRLKEAADRAEPAEKKQILLAAELSRRLLEGRQVELP